VEVYNFAYKTMGWRSDLDLTFRHLLPFSPIGFTDEVHDQNRLDLTRSHPCEQRLRQLGLSASKLAKAERLISEGEMDVTSFPLFNDEDLRNTIRLMIAHRGTD
jgi:hypothetical protein